jgi:hypothetical protein
MTTFDRVLAQSSAETLRERRLLLSDLEIPRGRGWNPLQDRVHEALVKKPGSIGQVVETLRTVQSIFDELPPSPAKNRVSAFNALYLKITRRVEDSLVDARQQEFLELLDIEFAKCYFHALDRWNCDDEATPDVWEVLFKRGTDLRMSRLLAAMLGVHAHINHDLSLALIATWNETGAPVDDRIHPDYLLVNEIFYQEIPPLRRAFSDDWHLELDDMVGTLDDWSQRCLVTVTRARAWDRARDLWELRHDEDDFEQARRCMDRAASFVAEWAIVGDRLVTGTGNGWRRLRRVLGRGECADLPRR